LSLIGFPDLETRKFFIEHLNQSNYKFQGVVYHGFDKKETTMELADFKTFKETVAALNVICFNRFYHETIFNFGF
jgi:hypothetical protein